MSKEARNNQKLLEIVKHLEEAGSAFSGFLDAIDPCLIDEDEQIIRKIGWLLTKSISELKLFAGCPG